MCNSFLVKRNGSHSDWMFASSSMSETNEFDGKHMVEIVCCWELLRITNYYYYLRLWLLLMLSPGYFTFNKCAATALSSSSSQRLKLKRCDFAKFSISFAKYGHLKMIRIATLCVCHMHSTVRHGMARHAHSMWESNNNNNYCDFTFSNTLYHKITMGKATSSQPTGVSFYFSSPPRKALTIIRITKTKRQQQ